MQASLFTYFMLYYILFPLAVTLEPVTESLALCVKTSLEITCTSTSLLIWELIPNHPSFSGHLSKVYTNTSSLEDVDRVGDFVTRLESTNPLVSTATLDEVDIKYNGSVLMCASMAGSNLEPGNFANIALLMKGKLKHVDIYATFHSYVLAIPS